MASKSSLKSIPSVKQSNPKSSSSSITQNLKPCNLSHSLSSPNLKISHQRFSTRAPSYRLITKAFIFDWFKPKPDPTKVQELSFGEMHEGDRDSTAYLPLGQKAVNSLGDLVPFTNKLYTGTIKSLSFVLLIIISLSYPFLISAAFGRNRASVVSLGWWRPIVNVTVPEVIETAQFALAEHNKQKGSMLKFARVVAGQYQVVAGLNYRLIIAAKNGAVDGKYEAVVYVGPWEHYKSLNSFGEV